MASPPSSPPRARAAVTLDQLTDLLKHVFGPEVIRGLLTVFHESDTGKDRSYGAGEVTQFLRELYLALGDERRDDQVAEEAARLVAAHGGGPVTVAHLCKHLCEPEIAERLKRRTLRGRGKRRSVAMAAARIAEAESQQNRLPSPLRRQPRTPLGETPRKGGEGSETPRGEGGPLTAEELAEAAATRRRVSIADRVQHGSFSRGTALRSGPGRRLSMFVLCDLVSRSPRSEVSSSATASPDGTPRSAGRVRARWRLAKGLVLTALQKRLQRVTEGLGRMMGLLDEDARPRYRVRKRVARKLLDWASSARSAVRTQRYADIRDDLVRLAKEQGIAMEIESSKQEEIDYKNQADPEMCTPEALKVRLGLRDHPQIKAAIKRMWDCTPRCPKPFDDCIDRQIYQWVARKMLGEFDTRKGKGGAREEPRMATIDAEWWIESGGQFFMDEHRFYAAVFAFLDVWVKSLDPKDYVDLANALTRRMTGRRDFIYSVRLAQRHHMEWRQRKGLSPIPSADGPTPAAQSAAAAAELLQLQISEPWAERPDSRGSGSGGGGSLLSTPRRAPPRLSPACFPFPNGAHVPSRRATLAGAAAAHIAARRVSVGAATRRASVAPPTAGWDGGGTAPDEGPSPLARSVRHGSMRVPNRVTLDFSPDGPAVRACGASPRGSIAGASAGPTSCSSAAPPSSSPAFPTADSSPQLGDHAPRPSAQQAAPGARESSGGGTAGASSPVPDVSPPNAWSSAGAANPESLLNPALNLAGIGSTAQRQTPPPTHGGEPRGAAATLSPHGSFTGGSAAGDREGSPGGDLAQMDPKMLGVMRRRQRRLSTALVREEDAARRKEIAMLLEAEDEKERQHREAKQREQVEERHQRERQRVQRELEKEKERQQELERKRQEEKERLRAEARDRELARERERARLGLARPGAAPRGSPTNADRPAAGTPTAADAPAEKAPAAPIPHRALASAASPSSPRGCAGFEVRRLSAAPDGSPPEAAPLAPLPLGAPGAVRRGSALRLPANAPAPAPVPPIVVLGSSPAAPPTVAGPSFRPGDAKSERKEGDDGEEEEDPFAAKPLASPTSPGSRGARLMEVVQAAVTAGPAGGSTRQNKPRTSLGAALGTGIIMECEQGRRQAGGLAGGSFRGARWSVACIKPEGPGGDVTDLFAARRLAGEDTAPEGGAAQPTPSVPAGGRPSPSELLREMQSPSPRRNVALSLRHADFCSALGDAFLLQGTQATPAAFAGAASPLRSPSPPTSPERKRAGPPPEEPQPRAGAQRGAAERAARAEERASAREGAERAKLLRRLRAQKADQEAAQPGAPLSPPRGVGPQRRRPSPSKLNLPPLGEGCAVSAADILAAEHRPERMSSAAGWSRGTRSPRGDLPAQPATAPSEVQQFASRPAPRPARAGGARGRPATHAPARRVHARWDGTARRPRAKAKARNRLVPLGPERRGGGGAAPFFREQRGLPQLPPLAAGRGARGQPHTPPGSAERQRRAGAPVGGSLPLSALPLAAEAT